MPVRAGAGPGGAGVGAGGQRGWNRPRNGREGPSGSGRERRWPGRGLSGAVWGCPEGWPGLRRAVWGPGRGQGAAGGGLAGLGWPSRFLQLFYNCPGRLVFTIFLQILPGPTFLQLFYNWTRFLQLFYIYNFFTFTIIHQCHAHMQNLQLFMCNRDKCS